MDPTTQFYISLGARTILSGIQIYYTRKQLQEKSQDVMAPASGCPPEVRSTIRLWPFWVLLFLSVIVWVPLYFSLDNDAPHLTTSQKRTLLSEANGMRTPMSRAIIAYTNGDRATEPLAHDFADVFKRAGIEPIFDFTIPDNSDQSGVILCVKDLNKPPPATEELKRALRAIGVEPKIRPFPTRGFGRPEADQSQLVIWIAPAPL